MSVVNTTMPAEQIQSVPIEPTLPIESVREMQIERPRVKLSWGGVFSGLVVALGVWMLLTVLGLAIGLTTVDPANPASLKSAGMLAGIWSAIVPLAALFAGGIVASRAGAVIDRASGAIHGIVLWGIASLAGVMMIGSLVSGVVGTATSAASSIAGAAGASAGKVVGEAKETLGLDEKSATASVNELLRSEGKPEVTSTQMQAVLRDVARSGVRQGRLDRETVIRSVTQHTRLSRDDATDVAARIEDTWNQGRADVSERAQGMFRGVETGALKAADTTGKAMWWVFLGMALSLGTAVAGGALGASHKRLVTPRIVPTPIEPRREVYP